MAAVTTIPGFRPQTPLARRPAGTRAATPRARRETPARYRRRRIAVAALALGVVVAAAQAGVALGGAPLATPERRPTSQAHFAGTRHVVVRPGDTLWSIALRLEPNEDPRPKVDAVAEALHRTELIAGETITWPR